MAKQKIPGTKEAMSVEPVSKRPGLSVTQFGPIKSCTLPVDEFVVFIGEQASGKSTLAKLLYFFQSVPELVEEHATLLANGSKQPFESWVTLMRQRFMESFGTTKHMPKFEIEYRYASGASLRLIQETKSGHVRVDPDSALSEAIVRRIKAAQPMPQGDNGASLGDPLKQPLLSLADAEREDASRALGLLTGCSVARVFVPAARSLLSVLSTELLSTDVRALDPLMKRFVRRIALLQQRFSRSMEEQLENEIHARLRDVPVDQLRADTAIKLVRSVLKGDYVYGTNGDRIEMADGQWVHLRYASSGQQEALWILLLLFSIILHNKPATVFMEEPEAHLFPLAQRDVINLLALCKNIQATPEPSKNSIVLTTHSPYVLGALNNLMHAFQVGSRSAAASKAAAAVIDRQMWLNPAGMGVWFVENGGIRSIIDPDLLLIRAEEIDGVSSDLRGSFDALADIEASS